MKINMADGVHGMVPRKKMSPAAKQVRDLYAITPCQPFARSEFGFYSLDQWTAEEGFPAGADPAKYFNFDFNGRHTLGGLGWCVAEFLPTFEEKILEDRGAHELVQDKSGRGVLYFKNRRSGFMPEYVTHPVKDQRTWEENCKWRLNPSTAGRFTNIDQSEGTVTGKRWWRDERDNTEVALKRAATGDFMVQAIIGGYMYLRSLIGPSELFYMFYENPALIHDCMKTWFKMADAVITEHQKFVTIDELAFAEDICYNHGLLISPDMVREFLFPYYSQLISNMKSRQLDQQRKLNVFVDTDGDCRPAITLYKEIGLTSMSPFEVASGCDVVEIGRAHPDLVMSGGLDKRILAQGKDAIDRMVDRIFPVMFKRGGYTPTCDHGVPEEVHLDDYKHYLGKLSEYGMGGMKTK